MTPAPQPVPPQPQPETLTDRLAFMARIGLLSRQRIVRR